MENAGQRWPQPSAFPEGEHGPQGHGVGGKDATLGHRSLSSNISEDRSSGFVLLTLRIQLVLSKCFVPWVFCGAARLEATTRLFLWMHPEVAHVRVARLGTEWGGVCLLIPGSTRSKMATHTQPDVSSGPSPHGGHPPHAAAGHPLKGTFQTRSNHGLCPDRAGHMPKVLFSTCGRRKPGRC